MLIQAIAACPSIASTILADVDRIVVGELRIDELVDGISGDAEGSAMTPESEEDDVQSQERRPFCPFYALLHAPLQIRSDHASA